MKFSLQKYWYNIGYIAFKQLNNIFFYPKKNLGTDSPQAMRKLMSLSEPGKVTRQRRAKHSVSSLHSMNSNSSPPASPPTNPKKVKGHERFVYFFALTLSSCLLFENIFK